MLFIIDVSRLFYKHNNLYLNMNDELKEIFRELEEQGWEPQLCNKPIRSFDAPVMCGDPNIVYGEDDCDSYLVPDGWVMDDSVFCTTVKGDSMIDANICEGDRVMVKETNSYNDGDVLLVMIDGRYTLKAYFKDKDGDRFIAIDLKDFGVKEKGIRLFRDKPSGMEEIKNKGDEL
jgi:hypothetical protein